MSGTAGFRLRADVLMLMNGTFVHLYKRGKVSTLGVGAFLIGTDGGMSARTMDWISNVAVVAGLVLLVAGVYLGLGLAAALATLGTVLLVVGVMIGVVVAQARQQERDL